MSDIETSGDTAKVRMRRSPWRSLLPWFALVPTLILVIAGVASVTLKFQRSAPEGQVLARVGESDLTRDDVLAEARAEGLDPLVTPQLLEICVRRELLAQEGLRRRLDRQASYPADRRRAINELDAEALLRALPVPPPPSAVEIDAYIATHSEQFADRKSLHVVELRYPAAGAPDLAGRTIEDARIQLHSAGRLWSETEGTVIESDLPTSVQGALRTASPSTLVVWSAGPSDRALAVLSTEASPLTGDGALTAARSAIQKAARENQTAELLNRLIEVTPITRSVSLTPGAGHGQSDAH